MTIDTIDPAAPDSLDPAGQGDDQLRALKQVIVDTFPQVPVTTPLDPWDIILAVGPRAINAVGDKADVVDLDALDVRVGVLELSEVDHESRITVNEADILALGGGTSAAWPIGSIFISADGGTPTAKGIPGTWAAIGDGQFLLGAAAGFGDVTGAPTVTIAAANLPVHKHDHAMPTKDGPNFGSFAAVGKSEYHLVPARSQSDSRIGEDANEAGWSIQNTSDGAFANTAVSLPNPPSIKVRFFERTA